jgi:hypothetical protein
MHQQLHDTALEVLYQHLIQWLLRDFQLQMLQFEFFALIVFDLSQSLVDLVCFHNPSNQHNQMLKKRQLQQHIL